VSVLVLGGNGFIGAPLMRALKARGVQALAAHRGPAQAAESPHAVTLDRGDAEGVARVVRECGVRVVIDLLAFTEADTAPVLAALGGLIERYVLISSGDVYRNYGGLQCREVAEPIFDPLPETAPLRTSRHPYRGAALRAAEDPARWMDDYDKIPLEQYALAAGGFSTTVLRLPMIYGPGDKQRRFGWLIRPMADGRAFLLIDEAWARWRTSYGFVDDVAEAIACAALHPDAAGGTFNVGPAEAPDHGGWAARFASALGWTGEMRPAASTPMSAALKGLDLRFPLVTDTSLIRARLGFAEPTPPAEALRRTIEDELAHPRPEHLDAQYAFEDEA
jgi:nucleoside-diphosphate-sugar epimerase